MWNVPYGKEGGFYLLQLGFDERRIRDMAWGMEERIQFKIVLERQVISLIKLGMTNEIAIAS